MIYLCGRCIHIDACLIPRSTGCVEQCKNFKEVPSHLPKQTNFNRITANEEALAEFIIDKLQYCKRPVCPICPVWKKCDGNSKESLVEWLKQESEK